MTEKREFWQAWCERVKRLPSWAKCFVVPLYVLCVCGFAFVRMSTLVVSLPFLLVYWTIEGTIGYRKRIQGLRSQGRVVSADEAIQCVQNDSGWLIVAETIKGPIGEVWLYRDGQHSDCVTNLPSLSARCDWGWPDENKDQRWDYYGPYHEHIDNVETFVLDYDSGEGQLVVGGRRSLEQIFSDSRVRVTFQG